MQHQTNSTKRKAANLAVMALTALTAITAQTAYQLSAGFGKRVAVTTVAAHVEITETGVDSVYATSVSIYNAGTSTLFCAVNCDPIIFTKMLADSTAVQIPNALSYTFKGEKIYSVCVATTNGTATAYIGAHADK
jgi:hypothetical protein